MLDVAPNRRDIAGNARHVVFSADQQHLRWSRFKNFDPKKLYATIADQVFPFIKSMGADESAFVKHMKDARFMLPPEKAGVLSRAV